MHADPLAHPEPLIRRVYSYVSYRLGSGADAEDVTSEVFERALRYRASFDDSRGTPLQWLLGIARRCVQDAVASRGSTDLVAEPDDRASLEDVGSDAVDRLMLGDAIARLDERARDLLALRYGADLTARQIGEITGMKTHAVEVALQRALSRLRSELIETADITARSAGRPSPGTAPR